MFFMTAPCAFFAAESHPSPRSLLSTPGSVLLAFAPEQRATTTTMSSGLKGYDIRGRRGRFCSPAIGG